MPLGADKYRHVKVSQSNSSFDAIHLKHEPIVIAVRSCDALTPPPHGTMTCQHSDLDETYTNEPEFPVDTVCSFACERGRTLVGSRQRTCLPLAHWDGLKTSCKRKFSQINLIKLSNGNNKRMEISACFFTSSLALLSKCSYWIDRHDLNI